MASRMGSLPLCFSALALALWAPPAGAASLARFLERASAGDLAADLTGDGVIDREDVLAFLLEAEPLPPPTAQGPDGGAALPFPIVFVSRQIPDRGSAWLPAAGDLPGVGPHSRVRPAAPGRLLVLETDGSVRTLIDGAAPSPASLHLIDVNAPAVSYDGQTIVFAGLPIGVHDPAPMRSVGAWRLYLINADGSGLRPLTDSSMTLDYSQFGAAAQGLQGYDDFDPVFLPDGRVCFSSTRSPAFAEHAGARASNLWVVNADGSDLHRITTDRNGADRPAVDPVTGRVVYARWWRNHRFPTNDAGSVLRDPENPSLGWVTRDGLTIRAWDHVAAPSMNRNYWQLIAINPDGSEIALWSGRFRSDPGNHAYGGSFASDGSLLANFFPDLTGCEAGGFGGIRRFYRGAEPWTSLAGVTNPGSAYVVPDPPSHGVHPGEYAAEPEALPDGRIVFSLARDTSQDYGLWVMNGDGSGRTPLLDFPGTSEIRARALRPRPIPPILRDQFRDYPSERRPSVLPPREAGPFNADGDFIFYNFNVYANAPVDMDMVSAPPVGSAAAIRFYLDFQRTSPSSSPSRDWPILLRQTPIQPDGLIIQGGLPGNVSMFEQLRSPAGAVPTAGGHVVNGAAHVAGMNFSAQGRSVVCVGCHAGHSMLPVPPPLEAPWTNLAPGARAETSSQRTPGCETGLVDRRAAKGSIWAYWTSAAGQQDGQWVRLVFPAPVAVRTVRLYNPRFGDEAGSTLQVHAVTVILCTDPGGSVEAARAVAGALAITGTDVHFPEVAARSVRILLDRVTGSFAGQPAAGLAEIEVIAKGIAEPPASPAGAPVNE